MRVVFVVLELASSLSSAVVHIFTHKRHVYVKKYN